MDVIENRRPMINFNGVTLSSLAIRVNISGEGNLKVLLNRRVPYVGCNLFVQTARSADQLLSTEPENKIRL